MSYDTASIEDEMEEEEDSSSIVTSGSFGDNPVLNAVTTLLSKQHSVSMGDVLPLNAQLLVLTNAQSKSTLEANNHLGTGQGSGYNKTDNSDAFIPSLEQVHALATANLLASTQRDIAQQLAEASFTNPETETNKRQLSRPSPVKKKDSKSGRKIIVKAKSSASDDDLITQELTALTCSFSSCKRKFASATHLKYHEMTHTNNRQFECPDENCGKTFYTAQRLKVHLRTHTGEKPFKCSHKDCEKTFTTAGNLKNHERIHTGEQPFTCDYDGCSRRFTEYSSLHKHKLTHSGDKPFECKICNKKFTQSGSRRQHLIRHHLDEEIRNSLKASRYAKTKNNSSGDTREKNVRKSMRDNQLLVKSEAVNSTVSCSPQLMVLSNAFHTHPSSESVVSEHLVSLSSGGNHHLSLSNCHQQHVTEQNKISASHSLLNGLCEKNLDGKSNELVALSQTSVYHSDEQDRGVLYVTDMLDHEEITHADYHVSQDDASEGMISPLEYHHHHHHQNDNSIQTDISLHHSSECHHSGLYQNQQDFIQHEDLQHPNTGEYHTDVKGDISSSYLTADAGVLHEEFIGTKEVTISSSSGLADVSEEDPSYIHVKESVSTLIDWDEHLHKH